MYGFRSRGADIHFSINHNQLLESVVVRGLITYEEYGLVIKFICALNDCAIFSVFNLENILPRVENDFTVNIYNLCRFAVIF